MIISTTIFIYSNNLKFTVEWREKIQQIRKADNNLDFNYINYLNSCNDVTFMNQCKFNRLFFLFKYKYFIESFQTTDDLDEARLVNDVSSNESDNSFITAQSGFKNLQIEDNQDRDDDDNYSQSSYATKITLPPLDYNSDKLRAELTNLGGLLAI